MDLKREKNEVCIKKAVATGDLRSALYLASMNNRELRLPELAQLRTRLKEGSAEHTSVCELIVATDECQLFTEAWADILLSKGEENAAMILLDLVKPRD